jgi:hypothetical protein
MTRRSRDNEGFRILGEIVCEAIPGPSVPRAPGASPDKDGKEGQRPRTGDEESKAHDLRPGPPADSKGEEQGT